MAGVLRGVPLGRNHRPGEPVSVSSSAAARSISVRICGAGSRGMVRWLHVWLPSSCPASRSIRTTSGADASHRPTASTVTWASARRSTATTWRTIAADPSPWKVSAPACPPRGPWVMSGPARAVPVGAGLAEWAGDRVDAEPDRVAEVVAEADDADAGADGDPSLLQAAREAPVAAAPARPSTARRVARAGEVTRPTLCPAGPGSLAGGPRPGRSAEGVIPRSADGVEPRHELCGSHGGAEEQALADVAAQVGEGRGRGRVLDALGHDAQPEGVGHRDGVRHDRRRAASPHVAAEHPVELELVEGQVAQVGQRGVPGAEVVE